MSKIVYSSNNTSDNLEGVLKCFEGQFAEDRENCQGHASLTRQDLHNGLKDMLVASIICRKPVRG